MESMKILLIGIILICVLTADCLCAEMNLDSKLRERVSYDFAGMPFEKVLQKVSADTGLNIIPLKSVVNSKLYKNDTFMSVRDMAVGQLLDWLAGAINAKYRIFTDGRIYFSQNYEWVEVNKFGMLFIDLKNMINGAQELEEFDNGVAELTKVITLFDDNYYIRTEQQADMIKLVAHIPQELKPVFVQVIDAFKKEGKTVAEYQSTVGGDNKQADELKKRLLAVKEVNYPYQPLNKVIQRLEEDFGVNIGCPNSVFYLKNGLPEISLKLGKVSLKEALECVIEKTPLRGAELSIPNGVWLTEYDSDWQQAVSRRFLWGDTLEVRSYKIPELNLLIPGALLAEEIMHRIAVRAWLDPLASVFFHEKTGNLIVLADVDTQNKVFAALQELVGRVGK